MAAAGLAATVSTDHDHPERPRMMIPPRPEEFASRRITEGGEPPLTADGAKHD
jgi:hypothetical protein